MSINNPALYDAAYSAIANSNAIWSNDALPSDYAAMRDAATNIATQIDVLIPTISTGPTLSELLLMTSIVKSTFNDRYALDMPSAFYATIASVIVAQWIEFGTGLQDSYVPKPTPSAFVYYLDSLTDPLIAHYLQLTPTTTFVPTTQATATATGTPTSTVQFAIGGNPVAWIVQDAIGVPFVQQGEWSDDLYASVNQPVSTTNIMLSFYSRSTGGVETHLFDITSPRVTSSTPVEASIEATEVTYTVDPTDRLVVKAFGVFTGTTVSTTATLYFQGTTNASHIHTPIEQTNPPT
jgi:hypothetical protein